MATIVKSGRATLYQVRSGRVPPLRDEKIITSWNGLMIAALARGYQILGDRRYLEAAASAVAEAVNASAKFARSPSPR